MRMIMLYGHQPTATRVWNLVAEQLQERRDANGADDDVKLLLVVDVEPETAHALRDGGGELWYCGPQTQAPTSCRPGLQADRHLLCDTHAGLAIKADVALRDFLGKRRIAA